MSNRFDDHHLDPTLGIPGTADGHERLLLDVRVMIDDRRRWWSDDIITLTPYYLSSIPGNDPLMRNLTTN